MTKKSTSTQQRRAHAGLRWQRRAPASGSHPLDGRGATVLGSGSGESPDWAASAPHTVNETKLGIIAMMQALGRATTSQELQLLWGEGKSLAVFDYHLSTLVRAGVAELLTERPELGFRLVEGVSLPCQPPLQGTVPSAGTSPKAV